MSEYRPVSNRPGCTLAVLLHAYGHHPSDLQSVADEMAASLPRVRIYIPELPVSKASMADPNDIVARLLEGVDAEVSRADSEGQPCDDIVLVGHSIGALLARKMYVVACGESANAPLETVFKQQPGTLDNGLLRPKPWAGRVSRIILLAGMNRGWRISHHLSLKKSPFWLLGVALCHAIHLFCGRWPVVFSIRRGAEFITQLRIQWIFMRSRAGTEAAPDGLSQWPGSALTVQLLGSRDDMVAPEDNIDLISGKDFLYLDVPYSGHADVIRLDDPAHGPGRAATFRLALMASPQEIALRAVVPADEHFVAPDRNVRRVVFVIHGIRDLGYWTHKIARRIRQHTAAQVSEWATETSSYGYFPMLPFLFPWYRRQKVEWLMDQYTEALARYPNASFSYVGHSNGTYLLAKALELYPCCRFENVVFAGSVVRRAYDWQRLMQTDPPRLKAVLNFVATGDWVVAIFPKTFQMLRLQDLGSAGHDGFTQTHVSANVHEIRYVKGGHGAAVDEYLWDTIADFIVTGHPKPVNDRVADKRNPLITVLGCVPVVVWAAIGYLAWKLWAGIDHVIKTVSETPESAAFYSGFSLAAYLLLLWLILTRV